jgi:hypothetical protein
MSPRRETVRIGSLHATGINVGTRDGSNSGRSQAETCDSAEKALGVIERIVDVAAIFSTGGSWRTI